MNAIVKKIGLELEMPLVKQDGLTVDFGDVEKLWQDFSEQGWSKNFDPNTKALIGVNRSTHNGVEMLSTDFGVCTCEAALAPVSSLDEAINYWHNFKSYVLLPVINNNNLKLLGYGNQPISSQLKDLIAHKGHYEIWKNMIEEDCREWILQNFPGLCSVQFNFEVSKHKALEIINTYLQILAFLWAASANDSIAAGKKLPYKSQRFHAYTTLSRGKMEGRCGLPISPYVSLCDYINRTWSVPIFKIIRDTRCLYPKDRSLTINKFITENSSEFYSLERQSYKETINLDDLKLAIYLSWPDFRLKFNFNLEIKFTDLVTAVHSGNDEKLLSMTDYIILEIRPISMQSNQEELDWLVLTYLLIENLESIAEYSLLWTYQEMKSAAIASQDNGLNQNLNGKTLGQIGLDLLARIPRNSFQMYEQHLSKLHFRFTKYSSPADEALTILDSDGMEALLNYLEIK
ncbi:glutamate-cysteine ligase family protein [Plectonema radiosum NIES-515]|uniref:glutamate--cysteine ligase n=1 Tax=Plectonema radiosum NIES-515 TaxID=2986073 RepID=A0ABT3B4P4_9CYAN|nr:glutamate-cysteine ligase family protein [Plectonema radiosum]MCV3215940.1 glutamate-cysteine ligase family protein [Plectonema radiosum NIES-515]